MSNEEINEHSMWQSVLWHLLPGILGGIAYYLIVDYVNELGFPSIVALIISGSLIIVPFQMGVLIFKSRNNDQKLFGETVRYFEPLKFWEYIFWVFVIIMISGSIMGVMGPVAEYLQKAISGWIPSKMIIDMGLSAEFTKSKLIITYILYLLFVVIIVPAVEELYFRGYLLPRMPTRLTKWRPIFHTTLFAIYHIWSPWMIVSRIFGVLPLTYVVIRKRNIYLGIISHCLLNSIDFFIGVVFISTIV
jgi:membrane protease YdiL (CAAX protease family)